MNRFYILFIHLLILYILIYLIIEIGSACSRVGRLYGDLFPACPAGCSPLFSAFAPAKAACGKGKAPSISGRDRPMRRIPRKGRCLCGGGLLRKATPDAPAGGRRGENGCAGICI